MCARCVCVRVCMCVSVSVCVCVCVCVCVSVCPNSDIYADRFLGYDDSLQQSGSMTGCFI